MNSIKDEIQIDVSYIDLKIKNEVLKVIEYAKIFQNLMREKDVVVVEKTFAKRYKNFKGQYTINYDSLRKLSEISGCGISCAVYNKVREIYMLLASQARARIGIKGNCDKLEVIRFINQLFGSDLKDDDEADSVVLALNGLIEGIPEYIVEHKTIKKRKYKKSKKQKELK